MGFSVDSNVFMQLWVTVLPQDVAPEIWSWFEQLGEEGEICVAEEVREEIRRKEDGLADWLRQSPIEIVPPAPAIQDRVTQILDEYEKLINERRNTGMADPWVVAVALERELGVITQESAGADATKACIPVVCRRFNVECLNIGEMFRHYGVRVRIGN